MGFVRSNQVIDRDFILSCTYELEVASQRVPCQAQLSPLYDPEMLRVRG
jgi:4-methylaminobutanoate oxidase (formaldehyde-forming)